jgi:hypothetical protein
MKKFFRKLVLKITYMLLKSRFGDKLTGKLDLEAQILSKGKIVFSKKLGKEDLIKIFEHELKEMKNAAIN